MGRVRQGLSYANVTATVALFVALGGGAYAATQLDRNSVKSKHIVNGQVKSVDVKPDSLGGAEIDEGTLGKVPDADTLDGKDSGEFAKAGSPSFDYVGDNNGPAFTQTNSASTNGCFVSYLRSRDAETAQRGDGDFSPGDDWVNYRTDNGGSPYGQFPAFNRAAFYRDDQGVVHLRGLVRRGASEYEYCGTQPGGGTISSPDDIFRLPPGYRPDDVARIFAVRSNNAPGELRVLSNGDVVAQQGDYQWVSLDGVSFRCAPSGQNGCP